MLISIAREMDLHVFKSYIFNVSVVITCLIFLFLYY